ncbi:hypothetical protein NE235_10795 [Actinoallomurus spadix]|uniref:Uncharacterized protein n=1 Tax=Actinoallomurus spadix TaxID=79912 RepID=A0ABN0WVS5_9ACTN|nr:hypothetical protein [Actinoallomurus spadix]MCO5986590.1 hypothetical protein [Actinoallomurus spadix]
MSYDQELREFREAIDGWVPVGRMSRDQELAELERLARRHPAEAKSMLEEQARLDGST